MDTCNCQSFLSDNPYQYSNQSLKLGAIMARYQRFNDAYCNDAQSCSQISNITGHDDVYGCDDQSCSNVQCG